ncbi:hypothetical protein HERIO_2640 [Hepatospora eriocheir]|uniref:Uncharacterized protein n=1 Tax=Hepatospora eriocheir TaxID=1081669 RepID=A0A1X0Q5Y0_9MICR|nr:hypothetical protein HERIO_2640 [Hepatospora eriocheir]
MYMMSKMKKGESINPALLCMINGGNMNNLTGQNNSTSVNELFMILLKDSKKCLNCHLCKMNQECFTKKLLEIEVMPQ